MGRKKFEPSTTWDTGSEKSGSASIGLAVPARKPGTADATPADDKAAALRMKTVLLVDDNDAQRIVTKWFLSNLGYGVESARDAEEALALFDSKTHDLVVTDNSMPGMSGFEMAHIIKLRSPATPVVMYTGNPPAEKSCLNLVIQRSTHVLVLKEALDTFFSSRTA